MQHFANFKTFPKTAMWRATGARFSHGSRATLHKIIIISILIMIIQYTVSITTLRLCQVMGTMLCRSKSSIDLLFKILVGGVWIPSRHVGLRHTHLMWFKLENYRKAEKQSALAPRVLSHSNHTPGSHQRVLEDESVYAYYIVMRGCRKCWREHCK